ncbi:MAG: DUF58 domain-containing protein [Stenotrophomonas acidaminiphila]|nr:DUF58 domain-containing protein [Stenotrophomonas acidaminiphila]
MLMLPRVVVSAAEVTASTSPVTVSAAAAALLDKVTLLAASVPVTSTAAVLDRVKVPVFTLKSPMAPIALDNVLVSFTLPVTLPVRLAVVITPAPATWKTPPPLALRFNAPPASDTGALMWMPPSAEASEIVVPAPPVLVYPAPEHPAAPLPDTGSASTRTRQHPLGDELQQLRPYRQGDPRRSIAWKHSARRDTLLVREYERPAGTELLLDWHALGPLPYERRIARLARWVDEAEREGRRYRLLLPGQPPLGPASGDVHRHHCLRALALMPAP